MKGILTFFILSALWKPLVGQVVLSEIMADPSPSIGLPEYEYVEIRNGNAFPVELAGWILADAHTEGLLPEVVLAADSTLILTSASGRLPMSAFGRVVVVSPWPSLNNDGDVLRLISSGRMVQDSVAYLRSWYGASHKNQGGWSLERIDIRRTCSGKDNWTASLDLSGGTPGRVNSVNASKPDLEGPVILQALWQQENGLRIVFSEPVEPDGVGTDNFKLLQGPAPYNIQFASSPDTLWLTFREELDSSLARRVKADNIPDCSGNLAGSEARIRWPVPLQAGRIRINEVLFDPVPGVVDFVELYNHSDSLYVGAQLVLDYWKQGGGSVEKTLSSKREILFEPHQYILISREPDVVLSAFGGPAGLTAEAWPMFNIPDEGGILVLRVNGILQDSVIVRESFHHQVLMDTEGYSLERIDPDQPGTIAAAWMSSARGATPGKENSQRVSLIPTIDLIAIRPDIVRPMEVIDNVLLIQLNLPLTGITGSLRVFDLHGILQATISENEVLGVRQVLRWDVTTDSGMVLSPGYYVLVCEFFGPQGYQQKVMHRIIVGW